MKVEILERICCAFQELTFIQTISTLLSIVSRNHRERFLSVYGYDLQQPVYIMRLLAFPNLCYWSFFCITAIVAFTKTQFAYDLRTTTKLWGCVPTSKVQFNFLKPPTIEHNVSEAFGCSGVIRTVERIDHTIGVILPLLPSPV